jgi:hypothetical protein
MELIIGETQLKCYEDGRIERFHKQCKKWTPVKGANSRGYLAIRIEDKRYLCHRIIYKAFYQEFELDSPLQIIDHINRIKIDNRIENLRVVTQQQNLFNMNAKGYNRHQNGFRANIMINGKQFRKCFATEDEARAWYLQQKAIHHII